MSPAGRCWVIPSVEWAGANRGEAMGRGLLPQGQSGVTMKHLEAAAEQILGKTIVGVGGVWREAGYARLFLIFSDDSSYEVFAPEGLDGSKTVSPGGLDLVRSIASRSDPAARAFVVPRSKSPQPSSGS